MVKRRFTITDQPRDAKWIIFLPTRFMFFCIEEEVFVWTHLVRALASLFFSVVFLNWPSPVGSFVMFAFIQYILFLLVRKKKLKRR